MSTSNYSYFASRYFGLYRCADWHYDNSVPTWEPIGNDPTGGDGLNIFRFALDYTQPDDFQAIVVGVTIYVRRPDYYGDEDWREVFSKAAAESLIGENLSDFDWVEINSAKTGHMYCLGKSARGWPSTNYLWLFISNDYGLSWARSGTIYSTANIRDIGGIWAGRVTGDTMYVTLNTGTGGVCRVAYSTDEGAHWAAKDDNMGVSLWVTKCMIDPTDENISYAGNNINGPDLARALTPGADYSNICTDAGICIYYGYGGSWISAKDSNYIRTARASQLYVSDDGGGSWVNRAIGLSAMETGIWGSDTKPNRVGVGRHTSGSEQSPHVLRSTENAGVTWHNKGGANADDGVSGGGDSLPYGCGGVAHNGLYLVVPGHVFTSVVAMRTLPIAGTVYADGVQMGTIATGGTVYAHGVEQESPRPE